MAQKKNKLNILYIALVLLLAAAPFICMTFARTDTSTENRRLAAFPKIVADGKLNVAFFSGLGKYFEDHFAFRNQIVAVDGKVQSLFGVSAVDTVIKGTDGWLYYTASANDFQGLGGLTARGVENAIYNIRLTQQFVESRGGKCLLTVAPNKNSLYPENMPYYYLRTGLPNNMAAAGEKLRSSDIAYADLFAAFNGTQETLYLMRDSHWNNKGAVLAYNVILDALGKAHETYDAAEPRLEKTEIGDLGRMVYSVLASPEENYYYDVGSFTFTSETDDVEAALLTTENPAADGNLLMFRDSFGNTLLPLMAGAYGTAAFSKATPYPVERYMDTYSPDTVILEKVERNFADFAKAPPIFSAPQATLSDTEAAPADVGAEVTIGKTNYDANYICISGTLGALEDATDVYALIDGVSYSAFRITGDEGDNGFMLYLKKGMFNRTATEVTILVATPGGLKAVCTEEYQFSEE